MSRRIALVDYGIGNLRSVAKAVTAAGGEVILTSDPAAILLADKLILPGVGAFGDGIAGLRQRGLDDVVRLGVERGMPLLGICLGMQLLFDEGEEIGQHTGLGLLPGRVKRFPQDMMPGLKIPQTGWNELLFSAQAGTLLAGLPAHSFAYFNHSYFCVPQHIEDVLAWTDYGLRYASVVGRGSVFGAQFHPEKSQAVGLAILRNFVDMRP
ncbi:MAG: imidazole glycerol phosphate synthase subunit HisH [Bellilinea sp.]